MEIQMCSLCGGRQARFIPERESEEEGRDTERVQQGKCIIIVVSGLQCMRHTHVNRILLLLVREAQKTTIER